MSKYPPINSAEGAECPYCGYTTDIEGEPDELMCQGCHKIIKLCQSQHSFEGSVITDFYTEANCELNKSYHEYDRFGERKICGALRDCD